MRRSLSGTKPLALLLFFTVLAFAEERSMCLGQTPDQRDEVFRATEVFVATIFPVTELPTELLEARQHIDNAFDPRGMVRLSDVIQVPYFPAPICYPYRFSDSGLEKLKNALSELPDVDRQSILNGEYPNIPQLQRDQFGHGSTHQNSNNRTLHLVSSALYSSRTVLCVPDLRGNGVRQRS
jgi:hypothetical protein